MRSRKVILAYLFAAAGWVTAAGTWADASVRQCAPRLANRTRDCGVTKLRAWCEPEPPARVFAGVTPSGEDFWRDRPREMFVREFRVVRAAIHLPLALPGMLAMAWADFITSLVKKNLPSLGTIMICTRSLRRWATVSWTSRGLVLSAAASSCNFSASAWEVTRI